MAKGSASGIKAGRAYVELGVNDKMTKALKAASAKLKAFGAGVSKIGLGLTGAAAAAAAPLAASVKLFSDVGDAVAKAAARTGLTTEAMSELGFAAEQSGSDMEGIEKGVRFMQKALVSAAEGSAAATDAFADLGISVQQLQGLTPDEQFARIADGIAAIQDPARKTAAAMKIFGKGGADLIPMLSEGSKGIEALRQEARDFGISLGGKDAKAAEVLNDTLNRMSKAARGVVLQIGAALAPVVTDMAQTLARVAAATSKWVEANRPLVVTIAKTIAIVGAVGAALVAVGVSISIAGVAIGGLASVFGLAVSAVLALKAAFLVLISPIGLVSVALAGGVAALLYFTGAGGAAIDWLQAKFGELSTRVTQVIGAIGDAMKAGNLALAAKIAWLAIKAEWVRGTGWLNGIWMQSTSLFVQTWHTAIDDVAKLFLEWQSLAESVMNDVSSFLKQKQSTWSGEIAKAINAIEVNPALSQEQALAAGKSKTEAAAIRDEAQQRLDMMQSRTDSLTQAEQTGIASTRNSEAKRIAEQLAGSLAVINGQQSSREEKERTRLAAASEAAASELAKAQEELRASLQEARNAREDAIVGGPTGAKPFADVLGGPEGARAKVESRGIFSAAALQSLQGGADRTVDRIAKATEDTAKTVRRLLTKASDNGLVFDE